MNQTNETNTTKDTFLSIPFKVWDICEKEKLDRFYIKGDRKWTPRGLGFMGGHFKIDNLPHTSYWSVRHEKENEN